jgi:hypothetical protein
MCLMIKTNYMSISCTVLDDQGVLIICSESIVLTYFLSIVDAEIPVLFLHW